jgi:hypothetical protein
MTTTKAYDKLNRLTSISSGRTGSTPSPISFAYLYNSANQRTRATLADGTYWVYTNDPLGQVTLGEKHWPNGALVAGQQFEYEFDAIGNRTLTRTGGDAGGQNLRTAAYEANLLNQYESRDVPGYVDVMGIAIATNAVEVNEQVAYRIGQYFREELAVDNDDDSVWLDITVEAVGETAVTGNVYVPETSEAFTHDADGNLTGDGRWSYTWDAENRAIGFERISSAPTESKVKLDCTYDHAWRRIQKIVSTNNGSGYFASITNRFVYDRWNLIAILDSQSAVLQSFTWGLDLSGTEQGAGGVGGLISMTVHSGANAGTYFYCYDGNGNVVALVNAADGEIAAQYEYGP